MTPLQVAGLILLYLITVYIAYGLTVWWEVTHGMSQGARETRGFFVAVWPLTLVSGIILIAGLAIIWVLSIPADIIHDAIYRKKYSR